MEEKKFHHHVKHHVQRAIPVAKKVGNFVQKHSVVLLLILVLALQFAPNPSGKYPWGGMWMRLQPMYVPVADSAASSSIDNFVRSQAADQVAKQYPNLPDANKQKVINDLMAKLYEQKRSALDGEKARVAGEIKDFFSYDVDGRKFLYMPDIDPYYYLRFARNLAEKGHTYDLLKDEKPWDDHMLAPIGAVADQSWHPHVYVILYKVYSFFDSGVTLMEAANYFPIVVILLSIICAFLAARRIAGNVCGFFFSFFFGLLPAVMGRTPWGHADTDAYNVFFLLLSVWLLLET